MKLYNLFFFRTDETVEVNTIKHATFDVEKTQFESFSNWESGLIFIHQKTL